MVGSLSLKNVSDAWEALWQFFRSSDDMEAFCCTQGLGFH